MVSDKNPADNNEVDAGKALGEVASSSGTSSGTKDVINSETSAIDFAEDLKIQEQEAYIKKINEFLEQNEDYFGGKFKDIGANISAMEAETAKNYDEMKKVLNDAYAANKDAIEKSVAARKTAATGQYAGKGYAPEVMANITAMIENDPQMAEQLRSVTQKQAENLQNLQNTYNSWYNNVS